MRNCCSTYKEGQLGNYYNKNKKLIQITGVRKLESIKRSKYQKIMDYDFDVNLRGSSNIPKLWKTLAPIVEWSDLDIWIYLFIAISFPISFYIIRTTIKSTGSASVRLSPILIDVLCNFFAY